MDIFSPKYIDSSVHSTAEMSFMLPENQQTTIFSIMDSLAFTTTEAMVVF